MFENIVIGSGPAGVSVSMALIKRGLNVTMLDVGKVIEEEVLQNSNVIRRKKKLNPKDKLIVRGEVNADINGVQEKRVFGSSFANELSPHFKVQQNNTQFYISNAKGGLSNLWGRSLMPLAESDSEDWPLSPRNLDLYYKKVFEFVPLAGRMDNLDRLLPLHADEVKNYPLSSQGRNLDKYIQKNLQRLNENGFSVGQARLAACFDGSNNRSDACRRCGLCLHGCVFENLYTSEWTLEELMRSDLFDYKKNMYVEDIQNTASGLKVNVICDKSQRKIEYLAKRVFLAAGAISSTRIVLQSKKIHDEKVKMLSSDFYIFPSITLTSGTEVVNEKTHTCCQYLLQLEDQKVDTNLVNFQVYTYNDYYTEAFQNILGKFYPYVKNLLHFFLNRFVVVFCYLHSKNSSHVDLKLDKKNVLTLEGNVSANSKKVARRAWWKLLKSVMLTGILPLPLPIKMQTIGKSMHMGSTLPMSSSPEGFQTNILGEVNGMPGLHVVDAASFPCIPATSPTLVIMANAYRIGTEVDI